MRGLIRSPAYAQTGTGAQLYKVLDYG